MAFDVALRNPGSGFNINLSSAATGGTTKSLTYCVSRTPSATTKSLTYRIVRTIPKTTKSLIYVIAISRPSTKNLNYTIRYTKTPITKPLQYAIRYTHVVVTKSLTYLIARSITPTVKNLNYTIRYVHVAVTKSLAYSIRSTVQAIVKNVQYAIQSIKLPITKTLTYAILRTRIPPFALRYHIKTVISVTKSLQYTIPISVTPVTKSLKYCILWTPKSVNLNPLNVANGTENGTYASNFSSRQGSETLSSDGTTSWQGTRSLKCMGPGTNPSEGFTQIAASRPLVTPGGQYTLSAYVKTDSLVQFQFREFSISNTYLRSTSINVVPSSEFTRYLSTVTVGADCYYVGLIIAAYTDYVPFVCYVDGIQLEAGASATEFQLPGVAKSKDLQYRILTTTDITKSLSYEVSSGVVSHSITDSLQYAIQKIYSSTKSLGYTILSTRTPINLVPRNVSNGCENGTISGFVNYLGATLTADATEHWQGEYSLKTVTAGAQAGEGWILSAFKQAPIGTLTFSVYLKGSGTVYLGLYGYTPNVGSTPNESSTSGTITLTGTWTRYTLTKTFVKNSTTRYLVFIRTIGTQVATYYSDGLQLEFAATATSWTESSITGMACAYFFKASNSTTKNLTYAISASISPINKSLQYVIRSTVTLTPKNLTYVIAVTGSVLKQYALLYTIRSTKLPLTKTLTYAIRVLKSTTKTLTYGIGLGAILGKNLQYSIRSSYHVINFAQQYAIRFVQLKTKALAYNIAIPKSLSKTLLYVINAAKQIQQTLKYTIYSAKQFINTLTYNIALVKVWTEDIYLTSTITVEEDLISSVTLTVILDSVITLEQTNSSEITMLLDNSSEIVTEVRADSIITLEYSVESLMTEEDDQESTI